MEDRVSDLSAGDAAYATPRVRPDTPGRQSPAHRAHAILAILAILAAPAAPAAPTAGDAALARRAHWQPRAGAPPRHHLRGRPGPHAARCARQPARHALRLELALRAEGGLRLLQKAQVSYLPSGPVHVSVSGTMSRGSRGCPLCRLQRAPETAICPSAREPQAALGERSRAGRADAADPSCYSRPVLLRGRLRPFEGGLAGPGAAKARRPTEGAAQWYCADSLGLLSQLVGLLTQLSTHAHGTDRRVVSCWAESAGRPCGAWARACLAARDGLARYAQH